MTEEGRRFLSSRPTTSTPADPCNPDPCGSFAKCIKRGKVAACRCQEGYEGNPFTGCRRGPECKINSDCTQGVGYST